LHFSGSELLAKFARSSELARDYIKTLPIDEKQVIFFDEMPWLDNQKSEFLPAFEWFWNDWLSTRSNLIFNRPCAER